MFRIGEEEVDEVRKVIATKKLFRLPHGDENHEREVERFEREWAERIGASYSLCMSGGGTAALLCALAALEIGPGDEVLVPAYTWMATATAVLNAGAIPVLCEVDETLALDPADVLEKISPQTRAMIPVGMMGRPPDIGRLMEIARQHGLKVVEDCAQTCGASYRGKALGSFGDIGAFSFNYYKIISCGEGGAIVTSDRTLFDRAAIFHDSLTSFPTFAREFSVPTFVGLQFRASELMGAVLRVQLQRLDGILADLRRIGRVFDDQLRDEPNLRAAPSNDSDGDCRVAVALQFDSEPAARKFATAPGVNATLPIDTDRHVYSNWAPVLEHRVGHHPEMNPFNHPRNKSLRTRYSKTMCPRTLDILSRTVYIGLDPDWNEPQIAQRIDACRKAGRAFA